MIHDASRGCQDDVPKLTGWKKPGCPALNLLHTNIETRADHPALVKPPVQFNHDLPGTMVINILKLTNVAMALHDDQELDDHF
uniref:40S ribosomal protein S15a n=1 Tax=Arundo donax TaxID=35708 RepID=A0A0A9CUT9_ARUDO